MAEVRYPAFGKAFAKHTRGADVQQVAEAMGIKPEQVTAAQNGSYLPSIEELSAFARNVKLSRKQQSALFDLAMDDLAAANGEKPQAAPKKPERTSPVHPVNRW